MINITAQAGEMQGAAATIYSVVTAANGAANTFIDTGSNSAASPPPSSVNTSTP